MTNPLKPILWLIDSENGRLLVAFTLGFCAKQLIEWFMSWPVTVWGGGG